MFKINVREPISTQNFLEEKKGNVTNFEQANKCVNFCSMEDEL